MQEEGWQPPWPPIQVADGEWIIMRDDSRRPVAVVRALRLGPRQQLFYRVVRWAPTSDGRTLVGYFESLREADQSVLFAPKQAGPQVQPPSDRVSKKAAAQPQPPTHPAGSAKPQHAAASETERKQQPAVRR